MAAPNQNPIDRRLPRLAFRFAMANFTFGLVSWLFQSNAIFLAYLLMFAVTVVLAVFAIRELIMVGDGGMAPIAVCFLLTLVPMLLPRSWSSDMDGRLPTANNLLQVGMGLAIHEDVNKHLPRAAMVDSHGKPLLSWRVSLLPYVEHDRLFLEFKQDEPWDSPHNERLLPKMPRTYSSMWSAERDATHLKVFVGPGAAFEPSRMPLSLARDFPDGLSNTLLIVEAQQSVSWTKPEDLAYDPQQPLPPLGRRYGVEGGRRQGPWAVAPFQTIYSMDGFLAVFGDGSVRFIRADISESVLRAAIVRNDGQAPQWDAPAWDGRRDVWGRPKQ